MLGIHFSHVLSKEMIYTFNTLFRFCSGHHIIVIVYNKSGKIIWCRNSEVTRNNCLQFLFIYGGFSLILLNCHKNDTLRQLFLIITNKTLQVVGSLNSFSKPCVLMAKIFIILRPLGLLWCLIEIMNYKVGPTACPKCLIKQMFSIW